MIGDVFKNPFVNILSQAALGALTGGSSLLLTTLGKQMLSAIGQELIQQMGDQLGLPQSVIDAAQSKLAFSLGDIKGGFQNMQEARQNAVTEFLDSLGLNPVNRGGAERAVTNFQDAIRDIVSGIVNEEIEEAKAKSGGKGGGANGASGAEGANAAGGSEAASGPSLASDSVEGGFLFALAAALGKVLDEKMEDMKLLAEDMNDASNDDQSTLGSLGAKIQAVGQEMKILSQALDNAIKSTGESQSTLARKG